MLPGVNKTLTVRETGLLQMLCEKWETLSAGKLSWINSGIRKMITLLPAAWMYLDETSKFLSEDESVTIKTVKGVGLILMKINNVSFYIAII